MKRLDRQTISALFVALALVLAIGPAMGLAGASVQAGDDGATNETADGAQDATANHTADGSTNQTVETRMTADRITIDRISTDHLTIENLTIEGLNVTSTAVGAMVGASPGDMEGVTVDDGMDNETDDGADASDDDADEMDGADTDNASEDDTDEAAADDMEDGTEECNDHDAEDGAEDDGTDDAEDDGTDAAEDDAAEDDADAAEDDAAEDGTDDAEDDEMEPTAPTEPEGDSYNVSELDAPGNATVGDQLTVTAEISNSNDFESNQSVEFRIDGDVIERQYLELDGGASETVTFEIDTEGLEAGDYNHGVLTFDNGEVADISLEAEDDEEEAQPNASVMFDDQETNGSMVTVQNVNVSEGGFVAIHDSSLLEGEVTGSVIGVSEYLEPGEHEDVEVQLYDNETVPGAEFDQDALEDNQSLIAMPHLDSNENETYDFIETEGEVDGPYTEDGEAVVDDAEITVVDEEDEEEEEAEPNATVTFDDQETNGSMVTVQNVNVSEGGFVTIHDSSLLEGATFDSVVGTSEYLEPGEHEDVEVQLFDNETVPGAEFDQDALEDNQTLIAMPHQDTNDNETYDFLETEGEEDGPYTEGEDAVIDDAEITVVDDEEAAADEGEEDDGETTATLDVEDQSGDGETLEIGQAIASEDFYVVANYDGETSESDQFNADVERLDYTLTLDPAIESDMTVEVAILSAEDDEELTSQEIEYDVEEGGDADVEDGANDGDANETDGTTNETDGTTNETDGDATGVDDNESAALIA